jgi:membrane-bound lytic murein transglycosylase D
MNVNLWIMNLLVLLITAKASGEALHYDKDASPIDTIITKGQILDDPKGLISDDFSVPEGMRQRVQFWFDQYTKHDFTTYTIHHRFYPWIVFDRVEGAPILNLGRGHYIERKANVEQLVSTRISQIRNSLLKLSYLTNYTKISSSEQQLLDQVKQIPGSLKKNLRESAEFIRTQQGMRDSFYRGLLHSRKYMTYMEDKFRRIGLPTELTRLPFVESGFNENALSKVGASGIWQIMPQTGSAFVMVNSQIDERNSPLKATMVAAEVLSKYFRMTGSWPLAVTSYNHGIGGVLRAKKILKTEDLPTIIENYEHPSFKFASSNFYASFLAALYTEKYHAEIFKNPMIIKTKLLVRDVVKLEHPTNLTFVSEGLKIPISTLVHYNKDLRNAGASTTLPQGFEMHLPLGYQKTFATLFNAADVKQADKPAKPKAAVF